MGICIGCVRSCSSVAGMIHFFIKLKNDQHIHIYTYTYNFINRQRWGEDEQF